MDYHSVSSFFFISYSLNAVPLYKVIIRSVVLIFVFKINQMKKKNTHAHILARVRQWFLGNDTSDILRRWVRIRDRWRYVSPLEIMLIDKNDKLSSFRDISTRIVFTYLSDSLKVNPSKYEVVFREISQFRKLIHNDLLTSKDYLEFYKRFDKEFYT